MHSYNFVTKVWNNIDKSHWGNFPAARFGHSTYEHNSKLILFGGRRYLENRQLITLNDLWEYTMDNNEWQQIVYQSEENVPNIYEGTVVFCPANSGFQIFLIGGIVQSNFQMNTKMYKYDSFNNTWEIVGNIPAFYQGGKGVYHPPTHSIRYALSGYPNYDESYIKSRKFYSWEYSIEGKVWTPRAKRDSSKALYMADAAYLNEKEIAIVHGGQIYGSFESCFESDIWILDMGNIIFNKSM